MTKRDQQNMRFWLTEKGMDETDRYRAELVAIPTDSDVEPDECQVESDARAERIALALEAEMDDSLTPDENFAYGRSAQIARETK